MKGNAGKMPAVISAIIYILLAVVLSSCAVHKVESSKSLYLQAREAQESGEDLRAVADWKALVEQCDREIAAGHFLSTNYFMRATALLELGRWDASFEDLKQIHPEELQEEELWIYPLYAVLMGDYYSHRGMTSVAANFYQSVLKKSALKSSSVYELAVERNANNSIKSIELAAEGKPDAEKFRQKEYEDLAKDLEKYTEENPFAGVSHFLLSDLYMKTGRSADALEHLLTSIELGLPTRDLQRSAEFEMANLLSGSPPPPARLVSAILERAAHLWSATDPDALLIAGQNSADWMRQRGAAIEGNGSMRYLAVRKGENLNFLIWENVP